jgi:hypothetical protein
VWFHLCIKIAQNMSNESEDRGLHSATTIGGLIKIQRKTMNDNKTSLNTSTNRGCYTVKFEMIFIHFVI